MAEKINQKDYPKLLRKNPKIKWATAGMMVAARPRFIPLGVSFLVGMAIFRGNSTIRLLLCLAFVAAAGVILRDAARICKENYAQEMSGAPATELRKKVDAEAARSDKGILIGAAVGLALVGFLGGGFAGGTGGGICPHCGASVDDSDVYCPECGQPL